MKDAKGHGSDAKDGAAHQAGVEAATGPKFWNDVRDAYRNDVYGSIYADKGDARAGHIDYSAGYESGKQKVHIQMIATDPAHQRQGIATGMMNKLKEEFPGATIKWGGTTPEGEAFKRSYYGKRK